MSLYGFNQSLPTDSPSHSGHVGTADGDGILGRDVAVLDPWLYQDNRYCERCGGWEIVVFAWRFAGGRLGVCLGCGRPVPEPDTRMNSEAA